MTQIARWMRVVAAAALLLLAGCVGMPRPSAHVDEAELSRESRAVDLAWIDREGDRPDPRVVVVVLPGTVELVRGGVDAMRAAELAHVYTRLLQAELEPHFERTHAVRPEDDRLNNPPEGYDVLVVETHLVELNRGSEFLRWVVGFGAGATRVQIDGRCRIIGREGQAAYWSDRTGSWLAHPLGSEPLIMRDMKRLARNTARFVTVEVLEREE